MGMMEKFLDWRWGMRDGKPVCRNCGKTLLNTKDQYSIFYCSWNCYEDAFEETTGKDRS